MFCLELITKQYMLSDGACHWDFDARHCEQKLPVSFCAWILRKFYLDFSTFVSSSLKHLSLFVELETEHLEEDRAYQEHLPKTAYVNMR